MSARERLIRGYKAPENKSSGSGIQTLISVLDLLDALPFYALLVDEHHHILQANSTVRTLLRIEPKEIIGKYCPEVIHGLDKPWYACPLGEAAEKGRAIEREALDEKSGHRIRSAIYPTRRFPKMVGESSSTWLLISLTANRLKSS